jgi:Cys-tRNA(Pro)/Cys-tRNA(Cys) deacylase
MSARATPAVTVARRAGVGVVVHDVGRVSPTSGYGQTMAVVLAVDAAQVFKTLVVAVDGALAIAVVPVEHEANLKAVAAALGGKRAEMAERAEAERATGYVVGGISPLGGRRRLPTVVDASALAHSSVFVSAGRRGLELELAPADLVALTDAVVALIAAR